MNLQLTMPKKMQDKNYVFAPKNMGPTINTAESEYFPSLTIDGKKLFLHGGEWIK